MTHVTVQVAHSDIQFREICATGIPIPKMPKTSKTLDTHGLLESCIQKKVFLVYEQVKIILKMDIKQYTITHTHTNTDTYSS